MNFKRDNFVALKRHKSTDVDLRIVLGDLRSTVKVFRSRMQKERGTGKCHSHDIPGPSDQNGNCGHVHFSTRVPV